MRSAAGAFVGDIEQKPSAVSAIKVDGKRAYARVRDGEDVDLPARPVTVHELLVTDVRPAGDAPRRRRLGALQQRHLHPGDRPRPRRGARHRRAPHRAAAYGGRAVHARRRAHARRAGRLASTLVDISDVARRCFTTVDLDDEQARDVGYGRKLAVDLLGASGPVAVLDPAGTFLALYEQRGDARRPRGRLRLSRCGTHSGVTDDRIARGADHRADLALARRGARRPRPDRRHGRQLRRRPPRPPARRGPGPRGRPRPR